MVNKSTDVGLSQRTNTYAAREMLKHAEPVLVLGKFGAAMRMPKNKSTSIKWRRPNNFTAADTPLVEGVTPSSSSFSYTDVSGTLKQYGQVSEVTDVIEDTHEDPVLNDLTMMLGENVGRTKEALIYSEVKAGTNVFYGAAADTARSQVNDPISLNRQRAVVRHLKAQKARPVTKMLDGSPNYGTKPIEGGFIAVAHTDVEQDIRGMTGFTPVAEYGSRKPLCPEEIGSVENVRYILSPDLEPFQAAGSSTLNGMVADDSTNVDVYPVIFFGQEAYGHVAIKGAGSVEPTVISANTKTKDDPLGQRGVAGWKTWHEAKILNEAWIARLEVGVTAL